jgi:hypothetical protein
MRTTIDLPDDLHDLARSLAKDTGQTLSQTVAMMMRRAMGEDSQAAGFTVDGKGWPVFTANHPITNEDVRSLEDEW